MKEHISIGSTEWYYLKTEQIKSTMSEIRRIEMEIDMMNGQFLKNPKWRSLIIFLTTPILSMYYKKMKGLIQIKS
jgi:guanylate kinase